MEIDRAGLEILDRAECLRLLGTSERGRIAVTIGALPVILPVRFVLDVGRVVLCVGEGTVLERATDENVVSLQTDGVDPTSGAEWSVSVIGVARHLSSASDVAASARLPLPRWSSELTPCFVAISADQVSGRRTMV
jgi:nitroimidazol reductase NimA-like FMN-containing flavoprotein (pyridoxamine 5'-phosphate oxidase superfamily)